MQVVLTGSRGFIGSQVAALLEVGGTRPVRVSAQAPTGAVGPTIHCCDPADYRTLLPTAVVGQPFVLVHLAWASGRPRDFAAHVRQLDWLARLCDGWVGHGLSGIVVAGSAEEYGMRGGRLKEDDASQGRLSPYGWAKKATRELLANVAAGGLPVVWLRPFLVYGEGQTGDGMVVPYAIRQALAGLPANFTDGRQRRDFIHVTDVARAFVGAVEGVRNGQLSGWHCCNLGTGQGTAVRTVLERIGTSLGAGNRFRFGVIPRRPTEPEEQVADNREAARILGWQASIGVDEGLERLLQSVRDDRARRPLAWSA
jgi:nucleoside-diphosphate-sugar epimerase